MGTAYKHVMSVTVRDQPGVLVRIAGLFARRGFNIESLSVAQSELPGISRTTFVVTGDDETIEQVEKQLQKLIDVIKVVDHSVADYVDRELMLIKVAIGTTEDRMEIRQIAQDFRARIVDVHTDALMFEVTGGGKKIDAFIEQMKQYGILELMRTGQVALTRSAFTLPSPPLPSSSLSDQKKLSAVNHQLSAKPKVLADG